MKRQDKKSTGSGIEMSEGPNLYLFTYYSVVDPADDPETFTINVRGDSRRGAIANFRKKFEEGDYNILEIKDIDITDNSASQAQARASAEASNTTTYRMLDRGHGYLASVNAENVMDAYTRASQIASNAQLEQGSWRLIDPSGRQIYPEPSSRVVSVGPRQDDDIPELPGEFVADPMANAQTYIIKYVDPDGAVQQTAIDANSAEAARQWFQSNHPSTYHVTDIWRHTA